MKLKFTFLTTLLTLFVYAQTAPAYYNTVNFSKTRNELKSDLANLITKTHSKTISYSELKTLLGRSDVDPQNPSNLLLIYGSQSSGTHQRSRSKNGSWNREHVYAKSKGTPNLGTSGPGADGHHLRPADIQLNSSRGSLLFDDGNGPTAAKTSRGGWYPGDEWKGDVARILMYMYVRYNSRALPLNITYGPSTYSSDFPDILLKWNAEDPVSEFERQRNNIVADTQGNRNPFIDNPYLATIIWGGEPAKNTWPDTFTGTGGNDTDDTEAPSTPTNLVAGEITSSTVALSWTASTDNVRVDRYDIYVNNEYNSTVYYNNGVVTGLTPATTYSFYVIAKDAAGNKSGNSEAIQVTTKENTDNGGGIGTSCGIETFENIPASQSSYSNREWTNNGITWIATDARTDQSDDKRAITIRNGYLKSSTISSGIGSLKVRTSLPFSGSAGTFTLKINDVEVGKIPYSSKAGTMEINDINIAGNIVIELTNDSSNRVTLDNLSWTCYEKLATDDVVKKSNRITVYPNPINGNEFYIKGIEQKETVEIYNFSGQLVQKVHNVTADTKVRLNKLPKGIYIVKTEKQSTKIVIN